MLKSKIHRAISTSTELDYEGSIRVDENQLAKRDILPGEQGHVLDVNNGSRFVAHVITAPRGSDTLLLNDPEAQPGEIEDQVIIVSCYEVDDEEARELKPNVVPLA